MGLAPAPGGVCPLNKLQMSMPQSLPRAGCVCLDSRVQSVVAWISEEPDGPGRGVTPETDFQRSMYPQWNSETADD